MLHLVSARSGRNLGDIAQEAPARLLRDRSLDQADRRKVTIVAEQDAIHRGYEPSVSGSGV